MQRYNRVTLEAWEINIWIEIAWQAYFFVILGKWYQPESKVALGQLEAWNYLYESSSQYVAVRYFQVAWST